MIDTIKFSDELSIYTTKIIGIDNEQLSKDLELNCDIDKNILKGGTTPGIQSDIITTSKTIQKLENKMLEVLIKFLDLKDDYSLHKYSWVYISDSNNTYTSYHTHDTGKNTMYSKETPQWSLVYYVSFPNNLDESYGDGRLFFETKSGKEFSILPEESQLVIFSSNTSHAPGLNRNSTKKRIVFASNIAVLDRNKKYSKNEKTLL